MSNSRKRSKDSSLKQVKPQVPKVSWVTTPPLKHIRGSFAASSLLGGEEHLKDSSSAKQSRLSDSSPNSFVNEPTPLLLVFKKAKLESEFDGRIQRPASASSTTIAASQESRENFMQILNSIRNQPEGGSSLDKRAVVGHNALLPAINRQQQSDFLKENVNSKRIMKVSNQTTSSPTVAEQSPVPLAAACKSKLLSSAEEFVSRNNLKSSAAAASEKNYSRLLIVEVIPSDGTNILLKVLDESNDQLFRIYLDGNEWSETEFNAGVRVNLVFPCKDKKDTFLKSSTTGRHQLARDEMLIVDPDELISITTVADSFHCMRRSIIKDRIRIRGGQDQAIVHGNIIHALFQAAVEAGNFGKDWLASQLSKVIAENIEDLYAIGQSEEECFNLVSPFIDNIISWRDQNYLTSSSSLTSNSSGGIKMLKAFDIEERIWSPMYGLKGNIDVTAKVKIPGTTGYSIAPLELKTGNAKSISHSAQTLLYTLMLSDRYDTKVDVGMLAYLKKNETVIVKSSQGEQVGLIRNRNRIVHHIADPNLPPMIMNSFNCSRCFSRQECMVYHKAVENGTQASAGVGSIFSDETDFITLQHMEFIKTWEDAIRREDSRYLRNTRDLWSVDYTVRELEGNCISGLVIKSIKELTSSQSRFKYQYTLVRPTPSTRSQRPTSKTSAGGMDFQDSYFTEGDPIIVTEQGSAHPLGIGFLYKIGIKDLQVSTDRPIHLVSKVSSFDSFRKPSLEPNVAKSRLFTIDKDGFSSGMGAIRGNLFELFTKGGERRRRLIVDLKAPSFGAATDKSILLKKLASNLNEDQLNALVKVDSCNDYALVLGMPGTGKTTVIAQMIKMLVMKGRSVLLTSFTHSAVDNVLLKLNEIGIDFIRLGAVEKMHPTIKDVVLKKKKNLDTTEKLVQYYDAAKVVATTALGIGHPIFSRKIFDYCIVDESSQIALPVCLGPLQFAEKFVLVGDHYQLPPLFAQSDTQSETLSLFKHLCQAHPDAVTTLKTQYRMNKDIMTLSNTLIYEYRLKGGSAKVISSHLKLSPSQEWLESIHQPYDSTATVALNLCKGTERTCWIRNLLCSTQSVVFFDTDAVPALESKVGPWIENPTEAALVYQIVSTMVASGVSQDDIGVISPYRHQLKKLNALLQVYAKVEVSTVDKYQGRDKKCIIMSLTRSNSTQQTGDLLKDWQRLNVAITRAKQKLVFVGSRKTLAGSASFHNLIKILEKNEWVVSLGKDAHLCHFFPDNQPLAMPFPHTPLPPQPPVKFGRPPLGVQGNSSKTSSELF